MDYLIQVSFGLVDESKGHGVFCACLVYLSCRHWDTCESILAMRPFPTLFTIIALVDKTTNTHLS